jgi:hypothetical protein
MSFFQICHIWEIDIPEPPHKKVFEVEAVARAVEGLYCIGGFNRWMKTGNEGRQMLHVDDAVFGSE